MGNSSFSRRHFLAGLAVFALLSACGTSPPTRHFLLAARPTENPVPARGRIKVASVSVAKYLDQPQIVRHKSEYELIVADLERWGEGMQDMIGRILAEDLAARLSGSQVFVGDGVATAPADASVELYVERFDADPDGTVMLNVRWIVRRETGAAQVGSDRIAQRSASPAVGDLVAAMSDALAKLADRLAPLLTA